jgi:hypothetical protein
MTPGEKPVIQARGLLPHDVDRRSHGLELRSLEQGVGSGGVAPEDEHGVHCRGGRVGLQARLQQRQARLDESIHQDGELVGPKLPWRRVEALVADVVT